MQYVTSRTHITAETQNDWETEIKISLIFPPFVVVMAGHHLHFHHISTESTNIIKESRGEEEEVAVTEEQGCS